MVAAMCHFPGSKFASMAEAGDAPDLPMHLEASKILYPNLRRSAGIVHSYGDTLWTEKSG